MRLEILRGGAGSSHLLLAGGAGAMTRRYPHLCAREFTVAKLEAEAVEWGWAHEPTPTMFGIVNAHTKGSQHERLPVEAAYHLQRVGGAILSMVQ